MQRHTIQQYKKLFARYPFDFIILSVHEVGDQEFWTGDIQREHTQEEFYSMYYEEMLYLVTHYKNYSVLGHMDLVNRYDPIGDYPFEYVKPLVEEILKTVIRDGKGIEFNTSSHRYGVKGTTPSREILELYRDLGGEIITIGSDSHKPEHLGAYYDEAIEILKDVGFRKICTFDDMKPTYHEI